jgi:hypothetical protein
VKTEVVDGLLKSKEKIKSKEMTSRFGNMGIAAE